MKFQRSTAIAIWLCMAGTAAIAKPKTDGRGNPFLTASPLPYQAPPFDKIRNSDYQPALEAGISDRKKEIERITGNSEAPGFKNTIEALDKAGELLDRVSNVFSAITSANTNDTLQKIDEETAPKIAASDDDIYLNSKLFARINAVYDKRGNLKLKPEERRLLELTYQRFVLAGANLSEDKKAQIKKLNEEEALLSTRFSNMLIAAAKNSALAISKEADLEGLSSSQKAAYAKAATDRGMPRQWLIALKNTTLQPDMQTLVNRDTRQKLFDASWNRAEHGDSSDTRAIVSRLSAIRAQKAALLGFENYAAWKLSNQMAGRPETVSKFLTGLVPMLKDRSTKEAADIQQQIDKTKGGFTLQPWDWDHYANMVRKEKYDLDEGSVKPYFELNKVLQDGVFYAANQLYGITFKERHDLPVYHPDVRVFEVFDRDGSALALYYCDYFKRDNKSGGAWMNSFVAQSHLSGTKPVVTNNCNFTKPTDGKPALLGFDDVKTMFHEFGHALHGMFSDCKYESLSGTNTARDFVEFPSQFNEHWALDPKILSHYAVHYQTGQTIPQELISKIKKASSFNSGYGLTEAVEASLLDMQWHTRKPGDEVKDVDVFEKTALRQSGLNPEQVPPRYRSTYFLHIWGGGYSASYYAYQWTKMLAEDAYSWFEENGGMTRANGDRFRKMILSKGKTEDYATMFKAFRGHNPDIKPWLKSLQ